jgi:DNA replication protein DnaC
MTTRKNDIPTALAHHLKSLRLPTMRERFSSLAEQARNEDMSYEAYLLALCRDECDMRQHHRIERLVRSSRIPCEKTLEALDLKRFGRKITLQVRALLDGGFIDRRENILAFGNPGSGKTHLLCAIGQALIQAGHPVYFIPCSLLVQQLLRAKQALTLDRLITRLAKYDAIIIDDIGYVQHGREEMEVLFTLLAERYERGTIMLTSNLPFSKWDNIFKDPMTTAAAIDRLIHHSVILELNIKSYRMEHAQQGRKGKPKHAQ